MPPGMMMSMRSKMRCGTLQSRLCNVICTEDGPSDVLLLQLLLLLLAPQSHKLVFSRNLI